MKPHKNHRCILFLLCILLTSYAHADDKVKLASDDWCPFVCAQGEKIKNGFLVDVSIKAMALSGYHVVAELRPLTRAIYETEHHMIAGVLAPPFDQDLRLSQPITYSRACFYARLDGTWHYKNIDSLSEQTIGVIADYGYDNAEMDAYIAKNLQQTALIELAHGDTAGTSNLHKLMKGRYQVLLEHEAVMEHLSQKLNLRQQIKQVGCLEQSLPLTIGFSKHNPQAEAWLRALNDGLARLEASGELKLLRREYGIKGGVK